MSITGLLNFIHITKKVVLVNTFIEYVTNSTAGTVFTANNIEQDIISFNIFNLFYPPGTKLVVSFLIPGRERIDKEKVWTVYRYPFICLIFFLLGIIAILVVTGPLKGCGCFSRTHESPGFTWMCLKGNHSAFRVAARDGFKCSIQGLGSTHPQSQYFFSIPPGVTVWLWVTLLYAFLTTAGASYHKVLSSNYPNVLPCSCVG